MARNDKVDRRREDKPDHQRDLAQGERVRLAPELKVYDVGLGEVEADSQRHHGTEIGTCVHRDVDDGAEEQRVAVRPRTVVKSQMRAAPAGNAEAHGASNGQFLECSMPRWSISPTFP